MYRASIVIQDGCLVSLSAPHQQPDTLHLSLIGSVFGFSVIFISLSFHSPFFYLFLSSLILWEPVCFISVFPPNKLEAEHNLSSTRGLKGIRGANSHPRHVQWLRMLPHLLFVVVVVVVWWGGTKNSAGGASWSLIHNLVVYGALLVALWVAWTKRFFMSLILRNNF